MIDQSFVSKASFFFFVMQMAVFFQSLAPVVHAISPPLAAPINDASIKFTKNELFEHNHVWKVMNKSCFGKWSGTLQTFHVDKETNELIPSPDDDRERLNFRLWARRRHFWAKNFGIWSVWNLIHKGDETNIPLRRLPPTTQPAQFKIGFFPGCVLRIPSKYREIPRAAVELGFWDSKGDGMRRTVVIEYLTNSDNMELKGITLVQQQKARRRAAFIGNITVPQDIQLLPEKAPFDMATAIRPAGKDMEPVLIERVDLQTMKRTVVKAKKMSDKDKEESSIVLNSLVADQENDEYCAMALPNGLCTRFPTQLIGNSRTTTSFVFTHAWSNDRPMQALHIEYDSTTFQAVAATMYSYK